MLKIKLRNESESEFLYRCSMELFGRGVEFSLSQKTFLDLTGKEGILRPRNLKKLFKSLTAAIENRKSLGNSEAMPKGKTAKKELESDL